MPRYMDDEQDILDVKRRGRELAEKEEMQNEELKRAALKHMAETGSSDGLFPEPKLKPKAPPARPKGETQKPSLNIDKAAKAIKKSFNKSSSGLLDMIKEKMGM